MMRLYLVTCDDAVRYTVAAHSEDECEELIHAYEGHQVGFTRWVFEDRGDSPEGQSRVLGFEVLHNEPTTKP